MNKVNINGKVYEFEGNNISVSGDSIYVDGKLMVDGLSGKVKIESIEWKGDLGNLKCDVCTIHGNVGGDVKGDVITCGDVGGSVEGNVVTCKSNMGGIRL